MKSLLKPSVLINAALFQICWFACVVGSSFALTWPALLSLAALAIYQLRASHRDPTDAKLMLIALVLGCIFETLWVQGGMLTFKENTPFAHFAPLWILALWVAFALTVNHSMAWMKGNLFLPAILGAIGGPLAYYTGLKLGAVEYHYSVTLVSLVLALAWSASLVVLVLCARSTPLTYSTNASG